MPVTLRVKICKSQGMGGLHKRNCTWQMARVAGQRALESGSVKGLSDSDMKQETKKKAPCVEKPSYCMEVYIAKSYGLLLPPDLMYLQKPSLSLLAG